MTDIDLSLITDGLQAEREQGITIDCGIPIFLVLVNVSILLLTPLVMNNIPEIWLQQLQQLSSQLF